MIASILTQFISSDITWITSTGFVLGGFALFIFGINLMGDGLKSLAGEKVRDYIERYTSNLFMAILVGTLITAILHSSTAVTVISISLVRAGLMKLEQAIGITIGANIGTTITSVMIGLNIEEYAYFFVFIGLMCTIITKKKSVISIGNVVLGFGLLFVGLGTMSDQLVVLSESQQFVDLMNVFGQQPWLALLGGTVGTAAIQSSTAFIGIVQTLYANGAITNFAAIAFIYGSNVGTTLTAVMSGIGGSVSTMRASLFHAVYNVLGALIGMIVIVPYAALTGYVTTAIGASGEMYVAMAHLIFNLASTVLVFPFVKQFVILLEFLVPGEDKKTTAIQSVDNMDVELISKFPAAALELARNNIIKMGQVVVETVKLSQVYLHSKDQEDYDEVIEIENVVNKYDTELTAYLLKIAQQNTANSDLISTYSTAFQIVKNYERISDLSTNLVEFYHMVYDEKGTFSDEAKKDFDKMYSVLLKMIPEATELYETQNKALYPELNEDETYLDVLEFKCRERHFRRLKDGICTNEIAASVYVDILSNMERIGDHSLNIGKNVINPVKQHSLDDEDVYATI